MVSQRLTGAIVLWMGNRDRATHRGVPSKWGSLQGGPPEGHFLDFSISLLALLSDEGLVLSLKANQERGSCKVMIGISAWPAVEDQ